MEYPLKLKYRIGGWLKKTKYRSRTGPGCCTANCAAESKNRRRKRYAHGAVKSNHLKRKTGGF